MSSLVLNDELIIALTIMSMSGVAAWWSRNILEDINKVQNIRFFWRDFSNMVILECAKWIMKSFQLELR